MIAFFDLTGASLTFFDNRGFDLTGLLFFEDRFFDSTSASLTFLDFLLLPHELSGRSREELVRAQKLVSHNMVRFRSRLKTVLLFLDSHFSAVL